MNVDPYTIRQVIPIGSGWVAVYKHTVPPSDGDEFTMPIIALALIEYTDDHEREVIALVADADGIGLASEASNYCGLRYQPVQGAPVVGDGDVLMDGVRLGAVAAGQGAK